MRSTLRTEFGVIALSVFQLSDEDRASESGRATISRRRQSEACRRELAALVTDQFPQIGDGYRFSTKLGPDQPSPRGRDSAPRGIGTDARGAPVVEGRPEWNVSLAHSGNLGAVACSADCAVGVDVEGRRLGRNWLGLARRGLGELAAARVAAADGDEERADVFYRLWTAGEAGFKALRGTVALDVLRAEVDLTDWPLVRWAFPVEGRERCFASLPIKTPEGYVGSLCLELSAGTQGFEMDWGRDRLA